jgi:hypothetical protein
MNTGFMDGWRYDHRAGELITLLTAFCTKKSSPSRAQNAVSSGLQAYSDAIMSTVRRNFSAAASKTPRVSSLTKDTRAYAVQTLRAVYPQHGNIPRPFSRLNFRVFGYGNRRITFCRRAKKGIREGQGIISLKAGGFAANIAVYVCDIFNRKRVYAPHDLISNRLPVASDKIIVNLNKINRIHTKGDFSCGCADNQAVNGFKAFAALFVKKSNQSAGVKDVSQ